MISDYKYWSSIDEMGAIFLDVAWDWWKVLVV